MHCREWARMLSGINSALEFNIDEVNSASYFNIIDKIKEKLAKKHLSVYRKWEVTEFDINYLFSFRNGYISNLCTLLHISVQQGLGNIVNALLTVEDIDINAMDNRYEEAPLHVAAKNNHIEIVKALLESKANVDAVNRDKVTPLHCAAQNGYTEVVEALLENNANVFLKDENGKTPRDLASDGNIKQLLDRTERKRYRQPFIRGVITGCLMAVLGTVMAVRLINNNDIAVETIPIALTIITIAGMSLSVCSIVYENEMLELSTEVGAMQAMRVYYNQYNSRVLVV